MNNNPQNILKLPIEIDNILSTADKNFIEQKSKEIQEYFQLRMLLSNEKQEDFKRYMSLWNWAILQSK
jgi:hypothetical protein